MFAAPLLEINFYLTEIVTTVVPHPNKMSPDLEYAIENASKESAPLETPSV